MIPGELIKQHFPRLQYAASCCSDTLMQVRQEAKAAPLENEHGREVLACVRRMTRRARARWEVHTDSCL